jgi:hypothetical protein
MTAAQPDGHNLESCDSARPPRVALQPIVPRRMIVATSSNDGFREEAR